MSTQQNLKYLSDRREERAKLILENGNPEVEKEIELIIETPQKDVFPYCSCDKMFKRGQRKTQFGVKKVESHELNTCLNLFYNQSLQFLQYPNHSFSILSAIFL